MPRSIAICCLLVCVCLLQAASQVPMIKNGNIRYGPSLRAKVIVTLRVGDTVEVLAPVADKPGWYKVRFPRQGRAWIHEKVVTPAEDENTLRVIVDGARVRSDATIGGEVVTDLPVGAEVEKTGRKVGSWHAVYVPSATAYVYHSVLDPQALRTARRQPVASTGDEGGERPTTRSDIDQLWRQLQQIYREYHAVYSRSRAEASTLDWKGLVGPLKRVVDQHPDLRTRLVAERMRSVVVRMLHAGVEPLSPGKMGIAEEASQAGRPEEPATVTERPAQPQQPERPQEPAPTQEPAQTQQPAPTQEPEQPQQPAPAQEPEQSIATMPEGTVVEGWIEPRDVPGLGARYAILGQRGVAAFVQVPAGTDLDLKPLHWRRVRVSGEQLPPEEGLPAEYANVPTIEIADIRVVQ